METRNTSPSVSRLPRSYPLQYIRIFMFPSVFTFLVSFVTLHTMDRSNTLPRPTLRPSVLSLLLWYSMNHPVSFLKPEMKLLSLLSNFINVVLSLYQYKHKSYPVDRCDTSLLLSFSLCPYLRSLLLPNLIQLSVNATSFCPNKSFTNPINYKSSTTNNLHLSLS